MSTDNSDNPIDNLEMNSLGFAHTPASFCYTVNHVFRPIDGFDSSHLHTLENERSVARAVCGAAHVYATHICEPSEQAQWNCISKMLDNLQTTVQSEHMDNDHAISQLRGMQTGGPLASTLQTLGRVDSCWISLHF